jgi:hypothetical protein
MIKTGFFHFTIAPLKNRQELNDSSDKLFSMSAPNCPCPKKVCKRHGNCQKCVDHHKEKNELPYCARE